VRYFSLVFPQISTYDILLERLHVEREGLRIYMDPKTLDSQIIPALKHFKQWTRYASKLPRRNRTFEPQDDCRLGDITRNTKVVSQEQLYLDKAYFKPKLVRRDKEGHFMVIKGARGNTLRRNNNC
jgi:hypothetical protein